MDLIVVTFTAIVAAGQPPKTFHKTVPDGPACAARVGDIFRRFPQTTRVSCEVIKAGLTSPDNWPELSFSEPSAR